MVLACWLLVSEARGKKRLKEKETIIVLARALCF
jgi:hypothetical protein